MDKIIAIRGTRQEAETLRVNSETGAVADIYGNPTVLTEHRINDFLHTARILGYEVEVIWL